MTDYSEMRKTAEAMQDRKLGFPRIATNSEVERTRQALLRADSAVRDVMSDPNMSEQERQSRLQQIEEFTYKEMMAERDPETGLPYDCGSGL